MKNIFSNFTLVLTLIVFVSLLSCIAAVSPHDNFKDHMRNNIGKKIDDPTANWVSDRDFISSKRLANGNIENQYLFWKTCKYYFEIDSNTQLIVSWRFEGDKRDCRISP